MYGSQMSGQVAVLPASGIGSAAVYATSGPEGLAVLFLMVFTLYAAAKTIGKLMPKFDS